MQAPYGPASALTTEQVKELSNWLSNIEISELRARYDAEAMAKSHVYPQIWMAEGLAAFEDYLRPRFSELQKFIARAATGDQSVLVFFT